MTGASHHSGKPPLNWHQQTLTKPCFWETLHKWLLFPIETGCDDHWWWCGQGCWTKGTQGLALQGVTTESVPFAFTPCSGKMQVHQAEPQKVGWQVRCIILLWFLSVFVFVMDYKPWWCNKGLGPWILIGCAELFHGGASPTVMNSDDIMISVSLHCSAPWEHAKDKWMGSYHKSRHIYNMKTTGKALNQCRMLYQYKCWLNYLAKNII